MANQIDPSLYIPQYQEWVLPETNGNQRNPFETTFLPRLKAMQYYHQIPQHMMPAQYHEVSRKSQVCAESRPK